MKYKTWKRKYPLITYAIFRDPWEIRRDEDLDDHVLDFRTDAPDGTYDCSYGYRTHQSIKHGIKVKNGQFIPKSVADICYNLVQPNLIDASTGKTMQKGSKTYAFIESLEFDGKQFHLTCGS